jgi:5-methylthioribose kinase
MASIYTSAFDLTTKAGVEAYLTDTLFACTKAEALSGGMANFVFRLYLCQPHEGNTTLVLKHGQPYVKLVNRVSYI